MAECFGKDRGQLHGPPAHLERRSELADQRWHPGLPQHVEPHASAVHGSEPGGQLGHQDRRQLLATSRTEPLGGVVRDGWCGPCRQADVGDGVVLVGGLGVLVLIEGPGDQLDHASGVLEGVAERRSHQAHAAEVTDGDSGALDQATGSAELFVLPHEGHGNPIGSGADEALERVDRAVTADRVDRQAGVTLEISKRTGRERPKDAVGPTGVESQGAEPALQLGHVVAPQHGGAAIEQAIAEAVTGLDEGPPGRLVTRAGGPKASMLLKSPDSFGGVGVVQTRLAATLAEAEPAQPGL